MEKQTKYKSTISTIFQTKPGTYDTRLTERRHLKYRDPLQLPRILSCDSCATMSQVASKFNVSTISTVLRIIRGAI